jgi:hypothetical protein
MIKRPIQKCPDFNGKCIYEQCPAFKFSKPSLWKCKVCNEVHPTGSTCSDKNHYREPIYIKEFYICLKYNYNWNSIQ